MGCPFLGWRFACAFSVASLGLCVVAPRFGGAGGVLGWFSSPGWRFAYPALFSVTPSGLERPDGWRYMHPGVALRLPRAIFGNPFGVRTPRRLALYASRGALRLPPRYFW